MTLSILIWLPLLVSLIAAGLPRRLVGWVTAAGSVVTLALAISFLARFKTGHAGLQFATDKVWIGALGIHYKLGLDGLNVALVVVTTLLFSVALIWSAFREWDRPALFYFHFGARPERRARCLLRSGPGAVRRLLRPDADPVLLPDRDVGHGRARAGDDQARHLHAGRLVLHAGRGDRDRRARPRASTAPT